LRVAEEAGFDVPLTKDKNMCYQLNLEGRKIAVIALSNGLWPFVKKDNTTTDSCPKTVLSAVVFPPSFGYYSSIQFGRFSPSFPQRQ